MDNLFGKLQLLQFMIIILFFILSDYKNNEILLDKNTKYYTFLKKIVQNNDITKKFVNKSDNNIITYEKKYELLLKDNEYFYIFYNNNVYTYFFKEKSSNYHTIYFNGINNVTDIKIIVGTIYNVITSNFNYDYIGKLLEKKGKLYKIDNMNIQLNDNNYSVLEVFDYLYNKIYNINNIHNKIKLKINGFSLGGPISQLFTLLLLDKYKNKLDINIYNIESWFGGNKEIYDKLISNVNFFNLYNQKSIFYFFNKYCQKYFESNYLINNDNNDINRMNDINSKDYKIIFPIGIINYVIDNHLLSKILKT